MISNDWGDAVCDVIILKAAWVRFVIGNQTF